MGGYQVPAQSPLSPQFLMRVLILASLKTETGNFSTAERLRKALSDAGNDCTLACIRMCDRHSVAEQIERLNIQCVLGVHAWRAGALLTGCPVPYAVIFGGTDLNEHSRDEHKLRVMTEVVQQARYVVAFSSPMVKKSVELWPECKDKIILQHQAVLVKPSNFQLRERLKNVLEKNTINMDVGVQDMVILLLVAGLRPVKDPLYLVTAVSEWHQQDNRIHLVIIGPELDERYAEEVKAQTRRLPGVVLMPAIHSWDLHSALQGSLALVNTSLSEGMATCILEAMALDVPVLARNIPANAAVVNHKETGLLFDTPEEFVVLAKELLSSAALRMKLTRNAKQYVGKYHSMEQETKTYVSLVHNLTAESIDSLRG